VNDWLRENALLLGNMVIATEASFAKLVFDFLSSKQLLFLSDI